MSLPPLTAADYCKTCNAPQKDPLAVLMRCALCAVVNGQLPPSRYKAIKGCAMSLPYDIARCQGHPIPQCQDCQRRTETLHHPYRQSQMTVVFEDAAKCEHKIKEMK